MSKPPSNTSSRRASTSRTEAGPAAPILVTGLNGFLGRHLLEHLVENGLGPAVIGLDCRPAPAGTSVRALVADLADRDALFGLVREIRPRTIFHLAGSFDAGDLAALYRANVVSTANLIEAVAQMPERCRIVLASSAAVYGFVRPKHNPVPESRPARPVSHYGISKAAMETTARLLAGRAPHVDIVTARLFNLIGRGMSASLLPGRLEESILRIVRGEQTPVIRLGNLSSYRDFLDVRDAARAFVLLALRGKRGSVYNVASGRKTRIGSLVKMFLKRTRPDIEVVSDAARLKPNDPPMVYADIAKLKARTGWTPAIPLERTVGDLLTGQ